MIVCSNTLQKYTQGQVHKYNSTHFTNSNLECTFLIKVLFTLYLTFLLQTVTFPCVNV